MKLKLLLLTFCLFLCNIFGSAVYAYSVDDDVSIPQDAILLSQIEQTIYYDMNSDKVYTNKATAVTGDTLFEIKCKHSWFQAKNGKIDVSITCTALNHKARIKKIVGSHKAKDTKKLSV